jgi:hypothetical protein
MAAVDASRTNVAVATARLCTYVHDPEDKAISVMESRLIALHNGQRYTTTVGYKAKISAYLSA